MGRVDAAVTGHAEDENLAQTQARKRDSGKGRKVAKYGNQLETASFHLEQKNVTGQFSNGSEMDRRVTDEIDRVNSLFDSCN